MGKPLLSFILLAQIWLSAPVIGAEPLAIKSAYEAAVLARILLNPTGHYEPKGSTNDSLPPSEISHRDRLTMPLLAHFDHMPPSLALQWACLKLIDERIKFLVEHGNLSEASRAIIGKALEYLANHGEEKVYFTLRDALSDLQGHAPKRAPWLPPLVKRFEKTMQAIDDGDRSADSLRAASNSSHGQSLDDFRKRETTLRQMAASACEKSLIN